MKKRLLITGFDPFDGQSVNPSWGAVEQLPERIGKYELCKLRIPTVFGQAAQLVIEKADQIQADAILCVGLAGGRDAVTPERIGINIRSARIPDNQGNQPVEQPIVLGGPDGIFSTLPVAQMVKAIQAASIPAAVSNTAGTYVCNDVLYTLLHHFADTSVRAGFIHVPYMVGQGTPNLPLETTVKALEIAISVL